MKLFPKHIIGMALLVSALGVASTSLAAGPKEHDDRRAPRRIVELPAIPGWYNGVKVVYLQTDASDAGVAASQGANFVPALANVLSANPSGVDDIYVFTNFTQSNIVPSAPTPAGPGNTNAQYSPLWQVSTVTWADPKQAHTLRSEAEVLAAEAARLVTLAKTSIVVNCPIVYSPQGGYLPNTRVETER